MRTTYRKHIYKVSTNTHEMAAAGSYFQYSGVYIYIYIYCICFHYISHAFPVYVQYIVQKLPFKHYHSELSDHRGGTPNDLQFVCETTANTTEL